MLKIYEDSINYTCQVIKLPNKVEVPGLNNLCKVSIFGNDCLIGVDSDPEELYLFFPAECKIDDDFLKSNNLYRHSELNNDKTKTGFFENNGRVRSVKFKGVVSTGFICPLSFLWNVTSKSGMAILGLNPGDEFNSIANINICSKYYKKLPSTPQEKRERKTEDFIDGKMAPQHFDTSHLLKNCNNLNLDDYIAVTYKLHGTSARYFNTLVKRKLSLLERLCKFIGVKVQKEEYKLVCGSRKVIKSVDFKAIDDKNHWYKTGDLWTEVGVNYFRDNLNHGEAVYCEIIGKTYGGEAIQSGYTYGLNLPEIYIYRISNINSQGIEVDLSYQQMKERAVQLGIKTCPELFYGTLEQFILKHIGMNDPHTTEEMLNQIFHNYPELLEKPSILDCSVIEEGFCIRIDKYPKPNIYKIKSKKFLEFETKQIDKKITNIEDDQST